MSKRDYYEVLSVTRTASDGELKTAYRKLAMQWHPDRNPGDQDCEMRFKEISEAYDCLKDAQKRAAYDRYGHAAFENGGGPGGAAGFGTDFAHAFSDIFDDLFGMARRGRTGGRERGADLRFNLEITLEEAFNGKTAHVQLPTNVACETCSGTGAKTGTQPIPCKTCNGTGRLRHAQGFFTLERTCASCQGRGSVIQDPCGSCSGAGRIVKERTLEVGIPAGVEDGTRIRLGGEGEAGMRGGASGDLYIFLSIAPHAIFQREGADLFCRVPVSMVTATIGGEFEVPTVDGGRTRLKIPEGTQSGKRLRLQGKGMPILRSRNRGDMYVQVAVETPQKLTKRQKELLKEFDRESSKDTHPESSGFFAKVRELFE